MAGRTHGNTLWGSRMVGIPHDQTAYDTVLMVTLAAIPLHLDGEIIAELSGYSNYDRRNIFRTTYTPFFTFARMVRTYGRGWTL